MIVIFHNPDCGTSRNVVQITRDAGHDPVVIEYLQTGWTRPQLLALFAAASLTPREALRLNGTNAEAMGLPDASDDTIIDAMIDDPILVNRPIVACPNGTRLCRPSEAVRDLISGL